MLPQVFVSIGTFEHLRCSTRTPAVAFLPQIMETCLSVKHTCEFMQEPLSKKLKTCKHLLLALIAACRFDKLEGSCGGLVAKTGRAKRGEEREARVAITPYITVGQKKRLDWLKVELDLSIADLLGQWIDEVFRQQGSGMPRVERIEALSLFVQALLSQSPPDLVLAQKVADSLEVPAIEVLALWNRCTNISEKHVRF